MRSRLKTVLHNIITQYDTVSQSCKLLQCFFAKYIAVTFLLLLVDYHIQIAAKIAQMFSYYVIICNELEKTC